MSEINFAQTFWLWLLPLSLIPLWRWQSKSQSYPALMLLPQDNVSTYIEIAIRVLSALFLVSLIVAMAEPFKREQTVDKIGTGAHIVILLDRSASMNDAFARGSDIYQGSKNQVARAVLNRLVDEGVNDFYGLVSFSTSALYMLPLTQNTDVIRAGINSTLNRGRGSTAIEKGLALALSYFDKQPHTGSRVILLVSDGGGMISIDVQSRLRQQFRENQVAMYWIYLKSTHGNRLVKTDQEPQRSSNPEYFLNDYFTTLNVPYRAYEIEEPDALDKAIADIKQLNNQPLHYQVTIPRQDLAMYCYGLAFFLLLLLLPVRYLEMDTW